MTHGYTVIGKRVCIGPCGRSFVVTTRYKQQKYCTPACYHRARVAQNNLGSEYEVVGKDRGRYRILCTLVCKREGCESTFVLSTKNRDRTFCSRRCAAYSQLRGAWRMRALRQRYAKFADLIKQVKSGAIPLHEACHRAYTLGYNNGHAVGKRERINERSKRKVAA